MRRALELAEQVRKATDDNPCVGRVIVKAGTVIGEGYTHPPEVHAEAKAIRNAESHGIGKEVNGPVHPLLILERHQVADQAAQQSPWMPELGNHVLLERTRLLESLGHVRVAEGVCVVGSHHFSLIEQADYHWGFEILCWMHFAFHA